jgi:hypothetical protein
VLFQHHNAICDVEILKERKISQTLTNIYTSLQRNHQVRERSPNIFFFVITVCYDGDSSIC